MEILSLHKIHRTAWNDPNWVYFGFQFIYLMFFSLNAKWWVQCRYKDQTCVSVSVWAGTSPSPPLSRGQYEPSYLCQNLSVFTSCFKLQSTTAEHEGGLSLAKILERLHLLHLIMSQSQSRPISIHRYRSVISLDVIIRPEQSVSDC